MSEVAVYVAERFLCDFSFGGYSSGFTVYVVGVGWGVNLAYTVAGFRGVAALIAWLILLWVSLFLRAFT